MCRSTDRVSQDALREVPPVKTVPRGVLAAAYAAATIVEMAAQYPGGVPLSVYQTMTLDQLGSEVPK